MRVLQTNSSLLLLSNDVSLHIFNDGCLTETKLPCAGIET